MNVKRLARFLGWFSIGLGAAELLATARDKRRAAFAAANVAAVTALDVYAARAV